MAADQTLKRSTKEELEKIFRKVRDGIGGKNFVVLAPSRFQQPKIELLGWSSCIDSSKAFCQAYYNVKASQVPPAYMLNVISHFFQVEYSLSARSCSSTDCEPVACFVIISLLNSRYPLLRNCFKCVCNNDQSIDCTRVWWCPWLKVIPHFTLRLVHLHSWGSWVCTTNRLGTRLTLTSCWYYETVLWKAGFL